MNPSHIMITHSCVPVTPQMDSFRFDGGVVLLSFFISSQPGGERQSGASPVRCQSSQRSGQSLTLPLLQSTSLDGGGSSVSLFPSVRSSLSSVCTTSDLRRCCYHTSQHERGSSKRRRRTRLPAVVLVPRARSHRRHRIQQTRGEEGENDITAQVIWALSDVVLADLDTVWDLNWEDSHF